MPRLLLLLWLCALPAWSEDTAAPAAETVELPAVQAPAPPAPPPVTSPTVRDASGAISTVEAAPEKGRAADTASLLSRVPSVVIQDAGGWGQRKTLSLRGASPNAVLVLLDGIPLEGTGANADLSRIPLAIIDKLEVLKGAAGARYGAGGMGGVLNVVTRSPQGGLRLFIDGSYGSFATGTLSGGASDSLLGGDGLLLLHAQKSNGAFSFTFDDTPHFDKDNAQRRVRENNDAQAAGGLLRYRRALPRGFKIDVLLEGFADDRGIAGTVQNPTPDARAASQRGTAGLRLGRAFEKGQFELLAFGRVNHSQLRGGLFGDALGQFDNLAGAEAVYTQLFAERHALTAVLTAAGEWLLTRGNQPSWARLSAMLMDELFLFDAALTLNGSVRVDRTGPFTGFSPKLGAQWAVGKGFEVKGNIGQAHRPPGFWELYVMQGFLMPNPGLRPERALYADAAVAFKNELAEVSAGAFISLYEDLISYEYYPPLLARPYNFQAAQVRGIEVEGKITPRPWLTAQASYTLLDSRNLKDDARYYLRELPFRPRHRVFTQLVVGPEWLTVHGDVLYQSEQFQNRTETLVLPARLFLNAGATARLWRQPAVHFSVEFKNLLDAQSQDIDGYPLPPRAVYVTLALAWEREKKTDKPKN
ncbi:MAG: TonB-dependent receptor [Myxococcaceae bacterium]|nr:TonB-dependent receptor [Myxococcaceae bacterium]